jgi:hypothetical protein
VFKGLINDVKAAAGSLVVKYAARASVAVPFVIAFGFATAAGTVMLVDRFGHVAAYWMVAGGFTLIGVIATLAVGVREHEEEVAEAEAEKADTAGVASEVAMQAPLALLGALFSSPAGPASALGMIKLLGRNLPLVLMLVIIGTLVWPRGDEASVVPEEEENDPIVSRKPNGAHAPSPL